MKVQTQKQNNKKQNLQYWTSLSKQKKKLIVFYGEDVLDLTEFALRHPAGQKAISCYNLQDIKNILFRVYPHPNTAVNILKQFVVGKLKNPKQENEPIAHKGICKDKSTIANKKQENSKKVSFDMSKQNQVVKPKPDTNRQCNKLSTVKIEENIVNLQQDKPELMVPHFNVKFNCLGKATNNKN